jgi:hypothetical protein
MGESWGKDNIFFLNVAGKTLYERPFVHPHWGEQPTEAPTMTASMKHVIRNRTLFALGVILIELWYRKPLRQLRKPEDGSEDVDDPVSSLMADWNTAYRLWDKLYEEAGATYADVVRRCIRCDFDRRGCDLEDVAFQKAVFDGVVAQLKENLDYLRFGRGGAISRHNTNDSV